MIKYDFAESFITTNSPKILSGSGNWKQLTIQQFLDTSRGSKMNLLKFYDKCGKELWYPNIKSSVAPIFRAVLPV